MNEWLITGFQRHVQKLFLKKYFQTKKNYIKKIQPMQAYNPPKVCLKDNINAQSSLQKSGKFYIVFLMHHTT